MNKLFFSLVVCLTLFKVEAQELYFPPTIGSQWESIPPEDLGWCPAKIDSLYAMLEENNTHAFLLLRDGKIVLEKYFPPFGQDSIWYWASAGKSLTAFLVGIAQAEGHLHIEDSTSKYLNEGWSDCLDHEAQITVRHQLTMTSGFDDGVPDPYCTESACLVCLAEPGSRWAYHNAPYTLLDNVINSATQQSLNSYLYTRMADLTGINGLFVPIGYNNVFFSKARSMARFGLLVLNQGKWGSLDILGDSSYFTQMVNTSQVHNQSYGYLWWLNGKESYMIPGLQHAFSGSMMPNAPNDMIAALGKNGQFINVVPSQQLVLIRMGNAPSEVPVPYLLNDKIWEYINELNCSTASHEPLSPEAKFEIFPNPTPGNFTVSMPGHSFNLVLINRTGQKITTRYHCIDEEEFNEQLMPGVYFLYVNTSNRSFVKKVVISE